MTRANPRIHRTLPLVILSVAIGAASLALSASALIALAAVITNPNQGYLRIPLEPSSASSIVAGWADSLHLTLAGTTLVPVWIEHATGSIAAGIAFAASTSAGTNLVVGLLGLLAAVTLLAGRLWWRHLTLLVFSTGAVYALGTTVAQIASKVTAETISAIAQSDLPTWTEPGAGVGFDFSQPGTGLAVMTATALFVIARRSDSAANETA